MNMWRDPERWQDSDMTREEWLLLLRVRIQQAVVFAVLITLAVVFLGLLMSGGK
jgi:hypothetical protein